MATNKTISHAQARQILLRVGFAPERIDELLAQLPDPFDLIRDQTILARYGVDRSRLVDLLGGSP